MMPIRFRKTLNVLPGVRVNLSRYGVSTTVGSRGMHLTFNRHGVRQSVGLPGTGLSESSYVVGGDHHAIHHGEGRGCGMSGCGCLLFLLVVAGGLIYFGANALNLHPASFLTQALSQLLQSLALWLKNAGL